MSSMGEVREDTERNDAASMMSEAVTELEEWQRSGGIISVSTVILEIEG